MELNMISLNKSGGNDNGYPNDLYLGEVAPGNFITGPALATAVGMTAGVPINSEVGWLRFRIEGKFIWVAKRPFQYQISWDSLQTANVISGAKTIVVGGKTYKVRLLRGAEADPSAWTTDMGQDNPPILASSEWNRLMHRVCVNNPGPASNWAVFTNEQIGVGDQAGGRTICKEGSMINYPTYCVGRGFPVLQWFNYQFRDSGFSSSFNSHGWRPVLELVA